MTMPPAAVPATDGVKIAVTEQLAPAARLEPLLFVSCIELEFAPDTTTLPIAIADVPLLLNVAICGVLCEPAAVFPGKIRLLGETVAVAAVSFSFALPEAVNWHAFAPAG